MKNKRVALIGSLLFLICFICIFNAFAHPGRTDANGGHWDRKNGTYHFHSGEYEGKSSSGSSSKSEYIPFTPPYEPPTDNPYRNDKEIEGNSDEGFDITEILGIIFGVVVFVFYIGFFIVLDFNEFDGCLTLGIATILIVYLIAYLIEENPLWILGIIIISVIFIPLIKKLKKAYSETQNDIKNYLKLFDELDRYGKDVDLNDFESCIPALYEIGEDNLPKDIDSKSNWGKTFTLYKTKNGYKLHEKCNCCFANKPVHIHWYRNYRNPYELLCKKCAFDYEIPNMAWYDYYLKCKQAKEKYEKLRQEIEALHNKCNSKETKFLIIFSKKSKEALKEANKKYKETQNERNYHCFDI